MEGGAIISMIKTHQVKIYPNTHMLKVINDLFNYRRYCWNQALATWNDRDLVLVDRFYPSTQLCSECGYRKTKDGYSGRQTLSGDSIHKDHQKYYCYNCGAVLDRDENAVRNIINYK